MSKRKSKGMKRTSSSLAIPSSPIASCKRGYPSLRPLNSPIRPSGHDATAKELRAAQDVKEDDSEEDHLFSPHLKYSTETESNSHHHRTTPSTSDTFSSSAKELRALRVYPEDTKMRTGESVDGEFSGRDSMDVSYDSDVVAAQHHTAYALDEKKSSGHDDEEGDDVDGEEEWDFNPLLFIKSLPPYKEAVANLLIPTLLPKRTRRSPNMTLVLDLDETLVHCSIEPISDADIQFDVNFSGLVYQVFVRKRPYLQQFLEAVSKDFEVIVFTASQKVYAEKLLNLIDPKRNLIKYRLYRDSCLEVCDNFLKDLNVLGRDLRRTIIVDNSPHAFGYQVDNGIPIESWFDDRGDEELLKLLPILGNLRKKTDVRPFIQEYYQMQRLIDASVSS
eukprot:g4858.t1